MLQAFLLKAALFCELAGPSGRTLKGENILCAKKLALKEVLAKYLIFFEIAPERGVWAQNEKFTGQD